MAPQPQLLFYGRPGAGYGLAYRTNLALAAPWTEWLRFTLTNRLAAFEYPLTPGAGSFWRAFEFRAEPPRLSVEPGISSGLGLRLGGCPGAAYGVETAPGISNPLEWQSWTNFTLTNTSKLLLWPPNAEPQRFFRGSRANPDIREPIASFGLNDHG